MFITEKQWVLSNVSSQAQSFFSLYSVITFIDMSTFCTLANIFVLDFLTFSAILGMWSSQTYANTYILFSCDFDKANIFFCCCIVIKYHMQKKVEYELLPITQLLLMENYVAQKGESVEFIRKAYLQGHQCLLNFFDCKNEQSWHRRQGEMYIFKETFFPLEGYIGKMWLSLKIHIWGKESLDIGKVSLQNI